MIGGVTRHMLPHLFGVPHLHVIRPRSLKIYLNKRKRLHKKRAQLPQDHFGTPIWPPWRHVKTLYSWIEPTALDRTERLRDCFYDTRMIFIPEWVSFQSEVRTAFTWYNHGNTSEAILGDPGANSGGKAKSKRVGKMALFFPFFTFLCTIFFQLFWLSLAPTICHWVSEDAPKLKLLTS